MKTIFKSIAIVLLISLFFGCSKEDNNAVLTLPPTTLKIIVNDDSGSPVSQAQVKVFGSQSDYNNNLQLFATQLTNNQGEASFSPVNTYNTYYWRVTKDCKTSVFDTNNNHNNLFLLSDAVNTYSTTISDKGILIFTNNSSYPYNVYVNDQILITMDGNSTKSYYYPPANYSIKVVQQSGYFFSPTIKTYNVTLSCNSILTTSFPN